MAMSFPRMSRTSSPGIVTMSVPLNRICPPVMRPGSCTRRRMESAVTLLPQPDSPTMPRVSPGCKSKLTPSTALTTPSSVKNWVLRSLTCRTGAVTVSASGQGQRDGWDQDDVGRDPDGMEPVGRHRTPGWRGRLDAKTEEAQESLEEDGLWNAEGGLDDDRSQRVRQDVARQDLVGSGTGGPGCLDELPLPKG